MRAAPGAVAWQGSHSWRSRLSVVRLRVISTRPSGRHLVHRGLGVIARQRLFQLAQHLALVLVIGHVDEVDDDDAAEVAQAQLPCDRLGRFEIGAVDGLFEIAVPRKPPVLTSIVVIASVWSTIR
jgi:hypothetical protein